MDENTTSSRPFPGEPSPGGYPYDPPRNSLTLSALIFSTALLPLLLLLFFNTGLQRRIFYRHSTRTGAALLQQFVKHVSNPLGSNDMALVNLLIRQTMELDGIRYVAVTDKLGIIQAHSDFGSIGTMFPSPKQVTGLAEKNGVSDVEYVHSTGVSVRDFSMAITSQGKVLGSVHLGIAAAYFEKDSPGPSIMDVLKILLPSVLVCILGLGATLVYLRRMISSMPARQLPGDHDDDEAMQYVETALPEIDSEDVVSSMNGKAKIFNMKSPKNAFSEEVPVPVLSDANQHAVVTPESRKISRAQVTVLFAGIRGFKTYSDSESPEQVLKELNGYFQIASKCILFFDGYIDKFIGDAVIAVFAADPSQASPTERAVRCAVFMQNTLKKISKTGNQMLEMVGIGISSGVVLSGNVGCESQAEYTFIGESFKTAYSLSLLAGPGEIVLSKDAYLLIENLVSIEPLPPKEMMARTGSWESFRVLRILKSQNHGNHG